MTRRILILLLLSVLLIQRAGAVAAYPHPIKVTQPDGSLLTVTLHGDEYLHWFTADRLTINGIIRENVIVRKDDDGFYRPDTLQLQTIEKASLKRQAAKIQRAAVKKAESSPSKPFGSPHFLVMLIEFNDVRFTLPHTDSAFYRQLNQDNYTENNATGSVRDYFYDQSLGQFTPVFDVVGPITVPKDMRNFTKSDGQTQAGAPALLVNACQIADSIVDFSEYDLDNDGVIDNIFFYYAGYNAAEGADSTIWPHSWSVSAKHYFDGKLLGHYACTSEYRGIDGQEMAGIGTFCHEFGHVIGLPDFYDTNGETGGSTRGLWFYSLMCYGNYNNDGKTPPSFNCEERSRLGWTDFIPWLPAADTLFSMKPVDEGVGYRSPTGNDGEYFYYEFRRKAKWDEPLEPGLLIYHVDKSNSMVHGMTAASRWETGTHINGYTSHECFQLELSDEHAKLYPFGNTKTEFNANTVPSSLSWGNIPSAYALYDISCEKDTTSGEETASFRLLFNHPKEMFGTVTDSAGMPLPYAFISVNDSMFSTTADSMGRYFIVLEKSDTTLTRQDTTICLNTASLSNVGTSVFRITVTSKAYEPLTDTVTVIAGAKQHDFQLKDKKVALDNPTSDETLYRSGTTVEIYSIEGRLIARIPPQEADTFLNNCNYTGIVIVRCGSQIRKMLLR